MDDLRWSAVFRQTRDSRYTACTGVAIGSKRLTTTRARSFRPSDPTRPESKRRPGKLVTRDQETRFNLNNLPILTCTCSIHRLIFRCNAAVFFWPYFRICLCVRVVIRMIIHIVLCVCCKYRVRIIKDRIIWTGISQKRLCILFTLLTANIVLLQCYWPCLGSGVVRIDPLHFLTGCHTRWLNQV